MATSPSASITSTSPGLADIESPKNCEVIAGAGAHRHRCARQRGRVMIGLEPGTAPVALQLVTEKGDRNLFQSCDELGSADGADGYFLMLFVIVQLTDL